MINEVEIWETIEGFNGAYQVSNFGNIKSLSRLIKCKGGAFRKTKEHVLEPVIDRKGYCRIGLHEGGNMDVFMVHRIVAKYFIPNPENKPQVNHINGNPSDNHISNLEWATAKENMRHAFDVLKRKPSISTGDKCWLFGKRGKDHPCFGNKHGVGRKGILHPRSKPVKCDTLDMVFESACMAADLLGVSQANITAVCKGRIRATSGFTFRYYN